MTLEREEVCRMQMNFRITFGDSKDRLPAITTDTKINYHTMLTESFPIDEYRNDVEISQPTLILQFELPSDPLIHRRDTLLLENPNDA